MKKLLPFILLFFALNVFSQKEANFWYFGENAGLDFNTNPPTAITGSLSTDEGSASISDSNGNLLFYTDGSIVYDKNGDPMNNGTGLLGNPSSAQSAIIVPKPKTTNIYYIFTVTDGNSSNGVKFSEVDLNLNGGLGEVIIKNTNLNDSSDSQEKITSVKGEECNTFWVITGNRNQYQAYKIDDKGVNTTPVKSNYLNRKSNPRGYLKTSPDGTKLVHASANSGAYIYDFNPLSGLITNGARLSGFTGDSYGVEFSRDSKKLYISTGVHSQFINNTTRNSPRYASLTQFNLQSNNINDINASAKLIYSTNSGYRGALQLAPNGKIYYARSRQGYLGVINSPEKDFDKVNFVENGIFLNGKISTEGLPPFIQSFFSIIEIKDAATDQTINDENLQFCIGESKIIQPNSITGATPPIYEWEFDNGTISVPIPNPTNSPVLELTNLTRADNGKYSLTISLNDACGNPRKYIGTFNVEVYEAASATKPDDIIFCDTDRDGFNTFNLQETSLIDKILTGLDKTFFEVVYFDKLEDANSGNNPLPNAYTNPTAFSSQTIHARVQNKNAPDACFALTNFILAVTDLPIATQPNPLRICDDLESTSDTDGIINTFILKDKDDEIYGSLDKTQYTISYHTTQTGAETNDASTVIPKNANHSVNTSQTVFIRIENNSNTNCYDASKTLELIVDPLPVLEPNPQLNQCIEATDTHTTVNLTLAEKNISKTANVTFKYFENMNGTNQILNFESYSVQVNIPKTVYVEVTSQFGCPRELVGLTINVGQTNRNGFNDVQPPVCDDFLDAFGNNTLGSNDDTDNITNFYLDKNSIISSINPPANTTVFFYENATDRTNSLHPIDIANFRNDKSKNDITTVSGGVQFPIYYKILSDINNNCQGLGQFYVQINSTPLISSNTITPISQCDTGNLDGNYTNGSNNGIDLTQKIDELLQGTNQNKNDFEVTFYKTETAAFSGDMTSADYIANPTQYTNDVPASFTVGDTANQTIFIRLQNKITGCVNPHASFDIIINPLPIVTSIIPPLEVCDAGTKDGDVRNSLAQNINVSKRDTDVLGGKNENDFTITYHKTQADLNDLASTGIDKNSYDSDPSRITTNPSTKISEEVLFIRILNNTTGCFFSQSTVTIVVNPEPTFETISNLSDCDNAFDSDDSNGIIQNIDLDGKITEILGASQDPDDFIVTFHSNPTDVATGNNKLNSPYTNSNSTETIYVRIQNKATSCVNDDATFDVIINPLPNFTVTTPQILCLNNMPLNIAVENPSNIYTYVWADENGNVLNSSSTDNIDVYTGGNYTVTTTTTNGTNCSKKETITVNESNIATLNESHITIIDESNNIGNNDNISIQIETANNILGPGNYQFALRNDDNGDLFPSIGFQDEPLFENLEGGIYTIIVNDKNGCSPDTELQISVIQFPKFFTPNGDGKNDTWVIKGANQIFYPNSSINIFNRFGKLVAKVPIDGQGWDGTYNGKTLPSDDYWFNIQLIPANNGGTAKPPILKKGHFSLLRK